MATATLGRQPNLHTGDVTEEAESTHHSKWTRLYRVRQLLGPLKVPSGNLQEEHLPPGTLADRVRPSESRLPELESAIFVDNHDANSGSCSSRRSAIPEAEWQSIGQPSLRVSSTRRTPVRDGSDPKSSLQGVDPRWPDIPLGVQSSIDAGTIGNHATFQLRSRPERTDLHSSEEDSGYVSSSIPDHDAIESTDEAGPPRHLGIEAFVDSSFESSTGENDQAPVLEAHHISTRSSKLASRNPYRYVDQSGLASRARAPPSGLTQPSVSASWTDTIQAVEPGIKPTSVAPIPVEDDEPHLATDSVDLHGNSLLTRPKPTDPDQGDSRRQEEVDNDADDSLSPERDTLRVQDSVGLQRHTQNIMTSETMPHAGTIHGAKKTPRAPRAGPDSRWQSGHCTSSSFQPTRFEKLGFRCYMDKMAKMPDLVVQRWNQAIKPQLDRDLQNLIRNIDVRKEVILSNVQLCMVGAKHGNQLRAEPTIVITCGTKECRRKVERNLTRLKLHYLNDFGRPIKVRYQPSPSHWAASTNRAYYPDSSRIPYALNSPELRIEPPRGAETSCGLQLRFIIRRNGVPSQYNASLGGLLCIGGVFYGMTTAHTFLPDPNNEVEWSYSEKMSAASSEMAEILSGIDLHRGLAYSFLGQVTTINGKSDTRERLVSDWALFPMPRSCILPNTNGYQQRLTGIRAQSQLTPGEVRILHGDSTHTCPIGFLTQPNVSFHTSHAALDVREILLNKPLSQGVSGSWVVRDHEVYEYIVAVTGTGLSCFMFPMESAWRDIEAVYGERIIFGDDLHKVIRSRQCQAPLLEQLGTGRDIIASVLETQQDSRRSPEQTLYENDNDQITEAPRSVIPVLGALDGEPSGSNMQEKSDHSERSSAQLLDRYTFSRRHDVHSNVVTQDHRKSKKYGVLRVLADCFTQHELDVEVYHQAKVGENQSTAFPSIRSGNVGRASLIPRGGPYAVAELRHGAWRPPYTDL